jgi:RNA polymerase sigma factor (sigma-70 family)
MIDESFEMPADTSPPPVNRYAALLAQLNTAPDEQTMARLLEETQALAYRFSLMVCGHTEDAEDAMQDALLQTYRHAGSIRQPQGFRTWLYRTVKNACLMSRRTKVAEPTRFASLDAVMAEGHDPISDGPSPEEVTTAESERRRFRQAFATLPANYRLVAFLRDVEGLSTREVAEVVGISESNVKQRLLRARRLLRQALAAGMLLWVVATPEVPGAASAARHDGAGAQASSVVIAQPSAASQATRPYRPSIGQAGKDVVWVPTPPALLDTMLSLAGVTADDVVIDLGSGDGRAVIAAARRGARALGVEFNPELVSLSQRAAAEAGVADRARFVQGDMFEADISEATVFALYLLPENLDRLLPRLQALRPGTRIVANTFGFTDWDPDAQERVRAELCTDWCDALLWIVPARVAGTWSLDSGERLTLTQLHQILHGEWSSGRDTAPVSQARVRGTAVRFSVGDRRFEGQWSEGMMTGVERRPDGSTRAWRATQTP